MFEEEKKKLIIVYTKQTEKYATYLMQLIGAKDDEGDTIVGLKDGTVDAVLWNEKHYEDNRNQLPSSQYILFVGDSKLIKTESTNMNRVFDRFGLRFSVLGRRAAMNVDPKLLNKKDYESFCAFSAGYGKEIEKKAKLNFINTAHPAVKWIGALAAPFVYPAFIYGLISGEASRVKINDQQYTFLMLYSYLELLPDFLGD